MSMIIEKKQLYASETQYQKYISENNRTIKYAFVGDSHAVTAINPRLINGSFNFALYAENYIKSYYRLRKAVENDGVRIETIIFELDPHTFSSSFVGMYHLFGDMWYYSEFVSYDEAYEIYNDSRYTVLNYWVESHFPLLGNGKEFRLLFTKPEFAGIDLGFVGHAGDFSKEPDKMTKARARVKEIFHQQKRIDSRLVHYFRECLFLAKQNGMRIVFIRYPSTGAYTEAMGEAGLDNGAYYAEVFRIINGSIGNGYVFLDYSDALGDDAYFKDVDHINAEGAGMFSGIVSQDLDRLRQAVHGGE